MPHRMDTVVRQGGFAPASGDTLEARLQVNSASGGLSWNDNGTAYEVQGSTSTTAATGAEINRVADVSARIVDCTASTLALVEATHEGKIVTLNRAAGVAVTLPVSTGGGAVYKIIVGTTFTGAATVKVPVASVATFIGTATLYADGGATVVGFAAGGTDDTLTMAADNATGGIAGAHMVFTDVAVAVWHVAYVSDAAASEVTPFSATV
jgi:hypothetical protein